MKPETPHLDKIPINIWTTGMKYTAEELAEINLLKEQHIWVTGDKVYIPVNKMDTEHIEKCISKLTAKTKVFPTNYLGGKKFWIEVFKNELKRRK